MLAAIRGCWALFLGVALIMMGNGIQGTLIGIRANMEGFSVSVTGFVMSGYFVGFLLGAYYVPRVISRVGHVRVFGALASMASVSILVHAVIIDPWVWWFMRIITGLSYAGLYIVAESWVNEASTNETRGKMMSVYMIVMMGAVTVASLAVNLADPNSFELFTLVSVLVSVSVIPILLSVSKAPSIEVSENASILLLYKVSPLGVFAMFFTMFAQGTSFNMMAVYGSSIGLGVKEVSYMVMVYMGGTLVFQWPIGWLSDRMDRRLVLALVSLASFIAGMIASLFTEPTVAFYLAFFIFGGINLPMYSLCIAYLNDYLTPAQMVAASGTMVLIGGLGALSGSPIAALLMEQFGDIAFLWTTSGAFGIVFLFAVWRMTQRAAIPMEDQGDHVILSSNPISAALNPELDMTEWNPEEEDQPDTVEELFEEFFEDDENDEEDDGDEEDDDLTEVNKSGD